MTSSVRICPLDAPALGPSSAPAFCVACRRLDGRILSSLDSRALQAARCVGPFAPGGYWGCDQANSGAWARWGSKTSTICCSSKSFRRDDLARAVRQSGDGHAEMVCIPSVPLIFCATLGNHAPVATKRISFKPYGAALSDLLMQV